MKNIVTPDWIDAVLSPDLTDLRARGEGQEIEDVIEFPKNVPELAKEIAAFATSNAGVILIGVADNGDLIGLENASNASELGSLLNRLGGLVSWRGRLWTELCDFTMRSHFIAAVTPNCSLTSVLTY